MVIITVKRISSWVISFSTLSRYGWPRTSLVILLTTCIWQKRWNSFPHFPRDLRPPSHLNRGDGKLFGALRVIFALIQGPPPLFFSPHFLLLLLSISCTFNIILLSPETLATNSRCQRQMATF